MSEYVVELQSGCWLAPWTGDPGRTLWLATARRYRTAKGARIALGLVRKRYPFRRFESAVVRRVDDV